ncbi:ATP-binding protein [Mycetocola sp.]|uniref:ATP-binding protein n=1 Tax=Mycetocola sp. TaxID=1871042 RepID=UPI003989C152
MTPTTGAIRTPDQRLRVFVSSTLKELALERKFARLAIERLHLAPVMFELGARPHPPRELYRSYLAQSDVFVGIYAERYGWVAPGETVSGLEDEYNLAPDLPKLIYIREPAPKREERLVELLNRVRDDDQAAFKTFSTPQELRKLLEADLATLLAERFDQSRPVPTDTTTTPVLLPDRTAALPAALTELIGRETELEAVDALLKRESVRLVSLIGSGGIGKTRLAVEVANRAGGAADPDLEITFVDLSSVQDAALVPNAIAEALGVLDTGDEPVLIKLKTALRHRRMLIVIDNFEQVLGAAPTLISLLSVAPGLKFLITSRSLLRVTGEHAVEVGPLALPDTARTLEAKMAMQSPSVALFVERARAVKPDFGVTPENVDAIAAICIALDGVPLALELAAARIRMLPPAAILSRLDRRLSLLSGGARDLPLRQQALRSTIEWSTQLLGADEKRLLARLGVFAGAFSLDAVESVAGDVSEPGTDTMTALSVLVDNSLVRELDRGDRPYYSMLATVREYALEQLEASGELDAARAAHARYFLRFAESLEDDLEGTRQHDVIALLNDDRDNLRATARYFLDSGDMVTVAQFTWCLLIYWWVGGLLGEVRAWMDEVLASSDPLPERTRAIALYFTRSITLWHEANDRVIPGLTESVALFHRIDDRVGEGFALIFLALALVADRHPDTDRAEQSLARSVQLLRNAGYRWGEAMALVTLGRLALMQNAVPDAIEHFEQSLTLTRKGHDDLGTTVALQHLGWAQFVNGKTVDSRQLFEESLATAAHIGHAEGVVYGLEGLTAIAAAGRQLKRAGRLLHAADELRKQTGLYGANRFSFHERYLAPILAGEDRDALEQVRRDSEALSVDEAVGYALHQD